VNYAEQITTTKNAFLSKVILVLIIITVTFLYVERGYSAQAPEVVYQKACRICHDAGVAGAPRRGKPVDWKNRLNKPFSELVDSVVKGKGAMPPTGMCRDCTREDFETVIRYMSKDLDASGKGG